LFFIPFITVNLFEFKNAIKLQIIFKYLPHKKGGRFVPLYKYYHSYDHQMIRMIQIPFI
jgi:hypothetical protein